MKNKGPSVKRMLVEVMAGLMVAAASQVEAKPLKVFILAGQSNMEGPAHIRTIEGIGDDPATAPMYREMIGPDGKPVVCQNVWLSYLTGEGNNNTIETTGRMTAGYGSLWGMDHSKPGDKIGPEFTFGIYISKAIQEPILIIKTAWGGKSLHTDFRPPSAGPQPLHDYIKGRIRERKGDIDKAQQDEDKRLGVYYRYTVEHVRKVLSDIKRVVPGYDPQQGYELAGFVWLQAWNDWCDGWWYPPAWGEKRFDEYGRLMALFIRDIRKDLSAPKMPFVIGVAGFNGLKAGKEMVAFRKAMAAPSLLPEFQGNVVAVQTAPFWDDQLEALQKRVEANWPKVDAKVKAEKDESWENKMKHMAQNFTPEEWKYYQHNGSNAGYHYLGCAKTFALMGKAFAEALGELQKTQ
jgi:alpha-galactosidase